MTAHYRAAVAALCVFAVGCSNTDPPATPLIPSLAPPASIEYRVTGDIGQAFASIRYASSQDGLSVLPAVSLPFVAAVSSTDAQAFLFVEATATPVVQLYTVPAVLQVQIFVDGRVFREAYASGFTTLTATASGTWRR